MINQEGEFSIDIMIFEPDGLSVELDFYVQLAQSNAESDWDSKPHLEIYEYRVYSRGCEIELDLDESYLYDLLRQELRERTLEHYFNGGL